MMMLLQRLRCKKLPKRPTMELVKQGGLQLVVVRFDADDENGG